LIDKYASISAYHIGRGIAGAQRHEWSDALNDFDRAIHDTPNDARAYCHRGQLLAALQRWREAADDFERARTLADPSNNRLPTTPWWVSGIVSHKTARNLANSFPSQTPGAPPLLPKVDGIEWDVRLPSADGVLYVPCDGRPPGTREWSAVSHHRSVLRDVCQCDEDQTIVMACYVYSIGDQDCVFHFSADPKCTVSVNGRDVHNWRGDLFDREVLPVKLHAGWNSVVVAISIQNGRPGIYLRAVSKQSVPPEG
jgi:hypothetical protein